MASELIAAGLSGVSALEPFRILCSNCSGKLVIRHDYLLGQRIRCPRCQAENVIPHVAPATSMQSRPFDRPYDSTAITQVDDGRIAQQLANEISQQVSRGPDDLNALDQLDDEALQLAIESFRTSDANHGNSSGLISSDLPFDSVASTDLNDIPGDGNTPPVPADWQSDSSRKRRQVLTIATAVVGGLLLATAGLGIFLVMRPETTGREFAISGTSSDIANVQPANGMQSTGIAGNTDSTPLPVNSDDVEPSLEGVGPEREKEVLTKTDSTVRDADPSPDSIGTQLQPKSDSDLKNDNSLPVDSTSPDGSQSSSSPAIGIEASLPLDTDIPEAMRRLSGLFDPGSMSLLPDATTSSVNVKNDSLPEKIDVESLYHPDPFLPTSWSSAKDQQVARLRLDKQPLAQVLILLGQLGNVGIDWELDSIRLLRADDKREVSIDVEKQTLETLVHEIARQVEAVVVERDDHLALKLNTKRVEQLLPTDWNIADMVVNPDDAIAWKAVIEALVAGVESLRVEDNTLIWADDVNLQAKIDTAILLDQVRIASNLPQRSLLSDSVLSPDLGAAKFDTFLAKTGSRIVSEPMASSRLITLAASDLGCSLYFDWPGLHAHGFSNAVTSVSLVKGRTWPQIASRTIERHALVSVIDGDNSMVLTILPRQRRMWRTILVARDEADSLSKLRDEFRWLAPVDVDGRSALKVVALPGIGQAKKLYAVRICPPSVNQLMDRRIRSAFRLPDAR